VILGGGVAVCLLLSAHRAVIFVIAQLSCFVLSAKRLAGTSVSKHLTYFVSSGALKH